MNTVEIAIRTIQHYMYCPHRWGLMEIDRAWAENVFVTKANLIHERVHDPKKNYVAKGKKVYTTVQVYNDLEDYNLYGVLDCLELHEYSSGVAIGQSSKKYKLCIVEYKPSKPKESDYHEEDLMQVFAQKLCVDYVFGGDSDAAIYYADVKKRIELPLKEHYRDYDRELKRMLKEMRDYLKRGSIPPVRKGQKCSGCSMKDICMPTTRATYDFRGEIKKVVV